jgi:hypothetical protein
MTTDQLPRICYNGWLFWRVCPKCGRFVKADPTIRLALIKSTRDSWVPSFAPVEPNATCARCGRVGMPLEEGGELDV